MKRIVMAVVAAACVATAEAAFDVSVACSGELRINAGGGIVARPLVNYNKWGASVTVAMALREPGEYDLKGEGDVVGRGRWFLSDTAEGAVVVTNRFTLDRDYKADACGTRLYLPYARFNGHRWRADGKTGLFPTNTLRAGLFSGKAVREVTLEDGDETLVFTFPEPRVVHLSNDAAWCDAFSLRLQRAGTFRKGEAVTDVFTLAVRRPLTCGYAERVKAKRGPGWIPMVMKKGVVPGGATDCSSWGLQDAPAGKHGFLKRVGDHFEFPDQPGRKVKFYGVNLVSSCCWPEKREDADEMVARLVRTGYNTVRLHHFECAGGITSSRHETDGATLNPTRMAQMDYLVAELIKHGLYVTIDLYSYRTAPWKALGLDRPGRPTFMEMKQLIHLTDAGFENWKTYAANLLNHVNPHTGRAYRDEPGLPLICLVNEGSLGMGWSYTRTLPEMSALFGRDVSNLTPSMMPDFNEKEAFVANRSLARMTSFLRGMGVKALLTDMNNGPYKPALDELRLKWMDYNDNHFYVDHPNWLGKRLHLPFKVRNVNFFDYEGKSPLERAVAHKLPGIPYTITEWNFSSPGHFRHQGGLLMGSVAAENGWDGMWCFTWAHGLANLFEGRSKAGLGNFDVMLDPIIQANERALVALYLRGDAEIGRKTLVTNAAERVIAVETGRTQGGAALAGGGFATSGLKVALDGADGAVWATAMDGRALADSKRILVTHLTDVQNEGAVWADETKRITISRGGLPLLAEAGRAHVTLKTALPPATPLACWALETDGARRCRVPVVREGDAIRLTADVARDPSAATFLYELTAE